MINLEIYLQKAFKGELLSETALNYINLCITEVFKSEKNVLNLTGNFIIIGDIHG